MAAPAFNLIPKTPEHFAENIRAARVLVGRRLGFKMEEGTAAEIQELSQADQVRFLDALSAYIVSEPVAFSPKQVELARNRVNSESFGKPLADTSFSVAASEFFSDVAGRVEGKLTGLLTVGVGMVALGVAFGFVMRGLPKR